MTEEIPSIANLTEEDLDALLKRSVRNTVILGLVPALVLLIASGWRNAAMLLTGALISAASLLEWQRLARLMNARMKRKQAPRGAALAVGFFLVRLLIFAGFGHRAGVRPQSGGRNAYGRSSQDVAELSLVAGLCG
jgi:hypothetical protein